MLRSDPQSGDPGCRCSRAMRLWWVGIAAVLIGFAVGLAILGGSGANISSGSSDYRWLIDAVTSGLFVICGVVTLLSGLVLCAIVRILWEAGRANRRVPNPQGGQVIIEFAIALPIALMLVMIMTQSSLLMGGNLCVHYAAYCAARSAIVQIPRDLSGEPSNILADPGSEKFGNIRKAAIWAVTPVSSSSQRLPDDGAFELVKGLRSFFNNYSDKTPGWVRLDYLGRKIGYADWYTQVTMLRRESSGLQEQPVYTELTYPYTYAENEEVRVHVDHTFYLSVPYANKIFAKIGSAGEQDDGRELDFGDGEYGLVIHAASSLTNEGVRDDVDVESFY